MVRGIDVAEAAAIINVALIIVQFTYPLLISLVAVGILKRTTNAATWSVFGQLIQRSKWPFLLQTDTASGFRVDKRIRILGILSSFAGVLLAIAAAITPLGLHSTLRLTDADDTPFSYVKDNSAVGQATQSHTTYVANRVCGGNVYLDCPGNRDGYQSYSNATAFGSQAIPGVDDPFISSAIASNITDVFTSATNEGKSTVAGIFDIQYRSFINYNNQTKPEDDENTQWLDKGKPRTQGQFRYFQQFLLENKTRAIEGLIVSTGSAPGVGFRNHTLPPSSEYGYTWEEDILWLEPETVCTDLNITYDYTMPAPLEWDVPNARITDRGGFIDLAVDYPYLDLNDTQTNPQLLARSWKAAMLTNNILRRYFNESREDFRMGKEYKLVDFRNSSFATAPRPDKLQFSSLGDSNLDYDIWEPNLPGDLSDLRTDTLNMNTSGQYLSPAQFNLATVIVGYGGLDPLNISTAGTGAGLILGVGKMLDSTGQPMAADEFRMDPGTNWSQPLYACASSVKASIKRVSFQINGTASVSNLMIRDVQSKEYDSEDEMPIWGMENTGKEIDELAPFWGLVSEDSRSLPGLSTVQKSEFYLPASRSSLYSVITSEDSMAGMSAPLGAYGTIFDSGVLNDNVDYSGGTNWLLHTKWQQLSAQVETVGTVVDLIWTDLMANALVSSKSVLSGRPATNSSTPAVRRRDVSQQSAMMPAAQYSAGITYDWKYAIPALVFLLLYLALFAGSFLLFCTKGLNISILRFVLNQTSAGRAMTTERYQASSDADYARTSVWARVRGDDIVRVGKHDADKADLGTLPQGYHAVETKMGAHESTTAYSHS